LESIAEYYIDEQETLTGKDFSPEDREETFVRIRRMYETNSLLQLYRRFLEQYGYGESVTEDNRILYEDVYPMLYMKYLLWGTKNLKPVKHLVIDEMQDYSYLQFQIIRKLFSCPMTILGDQAQSMTEKNHDVRTFLREILGRDSREIVLNKSYRSTCEIMEFAAQFTDAPAVLPFERHGRKPQIHTFESKEQKIKACIRDISENDKAETIAVLLMDEHGAAAAAEILKEAFGEKKVQLLDKNSVHFRPGIVVTTYYLAKGLEFDSVYVLDGENPIYRTSFGKQAMYVCATRALHTLDIYQSEEKEA
jgi:DNA helicase-2/ATP-dependent DNA helicase PcrA